MPFQDPSGFGPTWDGWFGPSGRPQQESDTMSIEKIKSLIEKSSAAKAIRKFMPHTFKKILDLKKNAEVLLFACQKECYDAMLVVR